MKKILFALIPFALACPAKNTPTDVATPAPTAAANPSPLYLVRDSGKRCIAAPCPSLVAVDVSSRVEREITGIDLTKLSLDPKAAETARHRVVSGQVRVTGEITTVPKQGPAGDGTVLVISAIAGTPP